MKFYFGQMVTDLSGPDMPTDVQRFARSIRDVNNPTPYEQNQLVALANSLVLVPAGRRGALERKGYRFQS